MVRFTIPNHNQVVLTSLMKEIGLRSTPSLVFNLHVVSHPLSSSLPSSASSSSSSISAETVCQLHNGQQISSSGSNNSGSNNYNNTSPPVLMGNNTGNLLRILSPRSGSVSPSSRDCSSPIGGNGKTHILRNIPEWVLVTFSGYFREQVSKHRPKTSFRDEDEDEEDEGVTREGYETEFLHPVTLTVSGVPFPILKLIIDLLSQGSVDVPFTKVDDLKDGLKRLEILSYSVQDMEAKETSRRRIAMNPGMKPSRVFRSKSVSHMMFPIRESIEAD